MDLDRLEVDLESSLQIADDIFNRLPTELVAPVFHRLFHPIESFTFMASHLARNRKKQSHCQALREQGYEVVVPD